MQNLEKSLVIIKPDGVERGLIGEIISRFEKVGLTLCEMKLVHATYDAIEKHYTIDVNWKRMAGEKEIQSFLDRGIVPPNNDAIAIGDAVLQRLKEYMTRGPIIVMIWEGSCAIKTIRKIVGNTEPFSSPLGTIRGDYSNDSYECSKAENRSLRNLLHASGSKDEAEEEIKHWFD